MSSARWMLQYAVKVRWYIAMASFLYLLEVGANVSIVGIQKFIVDEVFESRRFGILLPLLAGLAVLPVLSNLCYLYASHLVRMGQHITQQTLLRHLFAYLHKIPISSFRKERTGKFVQHLTGDVNEASFTIASRLPRGVMVSAEALLVGILIGWASPVLLIGIVVISGFYVVLGKYFTPRVKSASKEKQQQKAELLVKIEEGIASSREVIAFNRQVWERSRFLQSYERYFSKAFRETQLKNKQLLAADPLRWTIHLLVLGYGGYMVMQQTMSIGTFVVVYQFASQLLTALEAVFYSIMGMASGMASVERVREAMNGEQIADGENRLENAGIESLMFRDVAYRYGAEHSDVLRRLSLAIPIGRKCAFVGPSGGGKSTIVQLLVRFYEPTEGVIEVNGVSLPEVSRQDWTERVAVVFQEPYLFPDTIRQNVLFGRAIDEETMMDVCRKMKIHEFIEQLPDGYDSMVGERGIMLSGGQRQRLALARALLGNPEILILDEATSALDLETERQVMNGLDTARKGMTTIVIAHRLSTVMDADVIFVMEQGRIAEQGTHAALMERRGVYRELVGSVK
jgi:ABC-type multidrug transport system fused ATPase/permease subunit